MYFEARKQNLSFFNIYSHKDRRGWKGVRENFVMSHSQAVTEFFFLGIAFE